MNEEIDLIFRDQRAIYYAIPGTGSEDEVIRFFYSTKADEKSNPKEKNIKFIGNRSETNLLTGFNNTWEVDHLLVKDNELAKYLDAVFEERQIVTDTLYAVDLDKPIDGKENTYYARMSKVTPVLTDCSGTEELTINGTLKGQGDITVGEFNISTKKFTANET